MMRNRLHTWGIVLAGGDGTRLKDLTTTASGQVIPKQFCSFHSRRCLLDDAISRAAKVALPQNICSVVNAKHRGWWPESFRTMPPQNVLVQPSNCGTAHGILFALLQIEARAPDSIVVMLPADHYVQNEASMARALRVATNLAADNTQFVYVLGAAPDRPDQGLGYIVPSDRRDNAASDVLRFVEKPALDTALSLIGQGALWNTFIFAGSVQTLLSMFDGQWTTTVSRMREAIRSMKTPAVGSIGLEAIYQELESLDFSRDVLERHAQKLRVLRVPSCGWTDLGTPARVVETIQKLSLVPSQTISRGTPALLDLAAQLPRVRTWAAG